MKTLVKILSNPKIYMEKPKNVRIIQTHISVVCLTGFYVYKFKKPVDFGFLDFTTLKKRKFYCEEELRLNRRLSPEIYLGIVELRYDKKNNSFNINGKGELVNYGIKMKEFAQDKILKNLLEKRKLTSKHITQISNILVDFYKKAKTDRRISSYGSAKAFKVNTDENFEQTKSMIGKTITKEQFDLIKEKTNKFYEKNNWLFEKRIKEGKIKECHGDLHTGNMFLNENGKVRIFDCIEFNERFKNSDVVADIAFLSMDLDFHGKEDFSRKLVLDYVKKSKDWELLVLLNFYKCYRAYVRGKVLGFLLFDSNFPEEKKERIKKKSKKYFNFAEKYVIEINRGLIELKRSTAVIMVALTGTGKTIISKLLSSMVDINHLSSDIIRKELFKIEKGKKTFVDYNKGVYSPQNRSKVYEVLLKNAEKTLSEGKSVILDSAEFLKADMRKKALDIIKKTKSKVFIVNLIVPDNIVKKWIGQRMNDKNNESDGHWQIYLKQKKLAEPFSEEEKKHLIVYEYDDYIYPSDVYKNIINKIIK
ncbi:MAG: AAA family ATPase [DPANN group archaeon]|nr:AAA family ATPase [DPANN group archaeon]